MDLSIGQLFHLRRQTVGQKERRWEMQTGFKPRSPSLRRRSGVYTDPESLSIALAFSLLSLLSPFILYVLLETEAPKPGA